MPATTDIHRGVVLADRYRVGPRIGSGGMAAVYEAEDEVLDRQVAVKRVHSDGSEADARRLRREAKLGASLTHPNLVMVYDTITADDGVFIVMEHVDGRPLSELIGEDGMPAEEVLPILRAVADALDYAHRNGIVHRDVKPANVLIGDDGTVKLVDLGAAIGGDMTRVTQTHEVIGTLAYLPPERLAGDSPGGPEADVYSLAVLAYFALTGARPWGTMSPAEHLSRTSAGPPNLRAGWPEIPTLVEVALQRALDPEPARRQHSASELVEDIDAGLLPPSEPTRALPMPVPIPPAEETFAEPAPAARPWARRGAAIVLAVCALAIVAIAFAATRGGGGASVNPLKQAAAGGHHSTGKGRKAAKPDASGNTAAVAPAATTASPETTASTTPAATPPSASGSSLNDQGFALIGQGRYDEAVPVLQKAVDELKSDPSSLTYAYALYNLGHALRLAGQPEAAIPILEQRLQIPNQTSTVQAELDAARAAAGESAPAPKPAKDGPPYGRALGHDKHGGVAPDEGD